MVTEYDTAAFDAAMEKNATLVVDFFADWCGPCRMLAPVMETLSEEFGDKARFVKINVDDNPELAICKSGGRRNQRIKQKRGGILSAPLLNAAVNYTIKCNT